MVKLPAWEYGKENTMTSKIAWSGVSPGEWGNYITLQERAEPVFLSACAMKWSQLQNENAPLRAMLNGKLQSVSEDIYDSFILREIAEQPEQFKIAMKWSQLQNENAPLRAMLNGKLQSVSEDIYDSFILREIAEQPEQFKMALVIGNVLGKYPPLRAMLNGKLQSVSEDIYDSFILREIAEQPEQFKMALVIGNVLGKYQLGISDVWISSRIDKMIENGILDIIKDAPKGDGNYRRILRKRVK